MHQQPDGCSWCDSLLGSPSRIARCTWPDCCHLQVANIIDVHRPWETLTRSLPKLEQRHTLIYSSNRCADEKYHNNGLNFRWPSAACTLHRLVWQQLSHT